jgi:hypothetical protein
VDPGPDQQPDQARPAERLDQVQLFASTALPSTGARILAFGAIIVAGACGGLIGFAVTDLQCSGDCTLLAGTGAVIGAVISAVGVAVIAVLVLRAMGEWRTQQRLED